MEAKTIKDIEAGEIIEHDSFFESSLVPEIKKKDEIGGVIEAYWIDTVLPELKGEWFQISREGNKIIIQPVIISYPEEMEC